MSPVYIPSKGRPNAITAAGLLLDAGVEFTLVVEPQESEAYWERFPKVPILVLEKNNQGLAYARRAIREDSRRQGDKWHWQVNDDIRRFVLREPGEPMKTMDPVAAFSWVENYVASYSNIALAGMEENLWPPNSTPVKLNSLPAQCMFVNNEPDVDIQEFTGFDDIDFLLRLLEAGWCTMSFNHVRIIAPTPGTNVGGLYGTDRATWCAKFTKYWFQRCGVIFNPGGSPGGRPNQRWVNANFKQRPQLKNLPKRPICQ